LPIAAVGAIENQDTVRHRQFPVQKNCSSLRLTEAIDEPIENLISAECNHRGKFESMLKIRLPRES